MTTAAYQACYRKRRLAADPVGWQALQSEYQANFRARHPEKKAAWNAVYQAVRSGRLIRPDSCERCGVACIPQASHDNYEDRLAVEWLCRPCHTAKDFPLVKEH